MESNNSDQILGCPSGSLSAAAKAMQFASIAYCVNDVQVQLDQHIKGWKAVWLPTKAIEGQFAYVASNGYEYVVGIRGSILSFSWGAFDNWFKQDFNILNQVKWEYPYNTATNPMISKGTSEALNNLTQLVDANGVTLTQFLLDNAIANYKPVSITGHSLGAYLSTAFAPYFLYQINQNGLKDLNLLSVLTFASPTAGNEAFADQYDAAFPNSWRYYNELDMIPYSAANVGGMANLFPTPSFSASDVKLFFGMTLADAINFAKKEISKHEDSYNSYYTQTNRNRGSIPLNTNKEVFSVKSKKPLEAWFEQVGQQHAHNHYLKFLGAPPINCPSQKRKSPTQ